MANFQNFFFLNIEIISQHLTVCVVVLGKDSRIGAGFRVGPNADFQVLVELGPQSETQPLGPDATSKREIRTNYLRIKNQTKVVRRPRVKKNKTTNINVNKNSTVEEVPMKQKSK